LNRQAEPARFAGERGLIVQMESGGGRRVLNLKTAVAGGDLA